MFFVPRDWSISSSEVREEARAIYSAMVRIREFYADELDGDTFRMSALYVIQANGYKEAYGITWNGRDIYEDGIELAPGEFPRLMREELQSRGYPAQWEDLDGYTAITFAKGAGGYAAGGAAHLDGGRALLGDWCVDSLQGDLCPGDYWFSGQRKQTGAAAHELGHAFTLKHPDDYGWENSTSIMGNWWHFPYLGLNQYDKDRIRSKRSSYLFPE
jgi:hypothetical protein